MFRAQDSVRDQLVAVKMFRLDAPPEQAAQIADALQGLVDALPRHSALLPLIAAGVERDMPYLVMTHSDVPSLDTRLRPGVPLDPEEALGIIRMLAEALDAAHARDIVHGSLHPRDIFVDEHGDCRVSGFGVGPVLVRAGLRAPVRRPYSAPESLTSSAIEPAADRFALGALAFELLSGRRLVGTGRDAAARCVLPSSAGQSPAADAEYLRTALAAMLAENPAHRPSSAAAFAQSLAISLFPRGSAAPRPRTNAGADGEAGAAAEGRTASGDEPRTGRHAVRGANGGKTRDDAPSADELELFARQGTLWEPESRVPPKPLDAMPVDDEGDPLALFQTSPDATEQREALSAAMAAVPPIDTKADGKSERADVTPAVSPVAPGSVAAVTPVQSSSPSLRIDPPIEAVPENVVNRPIDLDEPTPSAFKARPFLRLDQDEVDVAPVPAPRGPMFIDDEHAAADVKAEAASADAQAGAAADAAVDAKGSVHAKANDDGDRKADAAADADGQADLDANANANASATGTVSADPDARGNARAESSAVAASPEAPALAAGPSDSWMTLGPSRTGKAERERADREKTDREKAEKEQVEREQQKAEKKRTPGEDTVVLPPGRTPSAWTGLEESAPVAGASAPLSSSSRLGGVTAPEPPSSSSRADGRAADRLPPVVAPAAPSSSLSSPLSSSSTASAPLDPRGLDEQLSEVGEDEDVDPASSAASSLGLGLSSAAAASSTSSLSPSSFGASGETMREEPRSGGTTGSHSAFLEPEPAATNPLRLVALVLAIGLAVGGAAGYLVGKRGALQNGDVTAVPEAAPVAGAGPRADAAETAAPGTTAAGSPLSSGAAGRAAAGSATPTQATRGRAAATTGRLAVRSSPSRADVAIDGTRRGSTPLTLRDLPFGSHVVRVTRSGYAPEARRVTLSASRASETLTFELERLVQPARPTPPARPAGAPAADDSRGTPDAVSAASGLGALHVLSRPAGARVLVDGRPVGVTPLLLQDVAPGTRTVRLELAGHRPWTNTVQVTAGQRVRVAASLEEGPQ